jgi:oligosaccharyltransferase complex subunit alpha (ribophorin I)
LQSLFCFVFQNEVKVHYENNSPFLAVSNIVRVIEVSHWGNIAVEEVIDMYHTGAKLKGPFHRIDYMKRVGGVSSVKSFKVGSMCF